MKLLQVIDEQHLDWKSATGMELSCRTGDVVCAFTLENNAYIHGRALLLFFSDVPV